MILNIKDKERVVTLPNVKWIVYIKSNVICYEFNHFSDWIDHVRPGHAVVFSFDCKKSMQIYFIGKTLSF